MTDVPVRRTGPNAVRPLFGANVRAAGALSRFEGTPKAHGDRGKASLPRNHPAVLNGHTLFRSRVFDTGEVKQALVSGQHSAKVGRRIVKGPWRGFPVFTLTLEERATCPRSCHVWASCYGNGSPMSRRLAFGPALIECVDYELTALQGAHPSGFAVRLHQLGDFPDLAYAELWAAWLDAFPALHVWGYTAHPKGSPIGQIIGRLNILHPDRWAVRFSVAPGGAEGVMEATTVWRAGERAQVAEGLICPAQTGDTSCCSTCGLCWAPAMADTRIVFMGHGGGGESGLRARRKP